MIDIIYQMNTETTFTMLLSDPFGGYSPMSFDVSYELGLVEMTERSMRADMIEMGSWSVMRYYPLTICAEESI